MILVTGGFYRTDLYDNRIHITARQKDLPGGYVVELVPQRESLDSTLLPGVAVMPITTLAT